LAFRVIQINYFLYYSPTQGTGECGYYVMRTMIDIILKHAEPETDLPKV
jgi:hypothetical protein